MAAVASGSSSVVAVLGPGEAVHRDDLHGAAPGLGAGGEPGPEDLLGAGLDPVEQAAEPANVMAATAMHVVMVRFHMMLFLCVR